MSHKPNFTAAQLRAMSDEELAAHWAGWAQHTGDWFLCEMEVRRRQNASNELRGWVAIVISVVSLAVALLPMI